MAERLHDTPHAWAKPLRSYRLRGRPLTAAQQAAYDTLDQWAFPVAAAAAPVAAIATLNDAGADFDTAVSIGDEAVDLDALFAGPAAPDGASHRCGPSRVAMEIGFGMAETTLAMAAADRHTNIIAVDVHRPGVAAMLRGIADGGLTNIRVARGDAVEILSRQIALGALDEVRVFFPDPWPKAQHHRRRLVNAEFVALVASRLRVGGVLHLATDWVPYGERMRDYVAAEPRLVNAADTPDGFSDRPAHRPVTRFEQIGIDKGHRVVDVIATRIADAR